MSAAGARHQLFYLTENAGAEIHSKPPHYQAIKGISQFGMMVPARKLQHPEKSITKCKSHQLLSCANIHIRVYMCPHQNASKSNPNMHAVICNLVKNQLTISTNVYFWIASLAPYSKCLSSCNKANHDYHSFLVYFEIIKYLWTLIILNYSGTFV